MKAWQMPKIGDPWDELELCELASPEPGPGEVTVEVAATDLNFADILQCQGRYQVRLEPPFTPGMNTGGTVIAVGEGVDLPIGARLVGPTVGPHGGYAEESVMLAEQAQLVPDDIELVTASAIGRPHPKTASRDSTVICIRSRRSSISFLNTPRRWRPS